MQFSVIWLAIFLKFKYLQPSGLGQFVWRVAMVSLLRSGGKLTFQHYVSASQLGCASVNYFWNTVPSYKWNTLKHQSIKYLQVYEKFMSTLFIISALWVTAPQKVFSILIEFCLFHRKMPIKEFHLNRVLEDLQLSPDEVNF